MARNYIDAFWNRKTRNDLNKYFTELYDEYINAGLTASEAKQKALDAVKKSDQALLIAEQTQIELDQAILEGDSSPLGGQLSVGYDGTVYSSPQERLKREHNKVNSSLTENEHQLEQIRSDVKPLRDGIHSSTKGNMRMTAMLKNDAEVLPYFVDETLIGDTSVKAVNKLYETMNTNHIYNLYDELVSKDTGFRHCTEWGRLNDGSPLKWYHFEPTMRHTIPNSSVTGEPRFDVYNRLLASKPILFITSGIHGNEKTNVWALYLTIKDILDGKTELDRHIRRNYEIVVLPACNPYGLDHNTRNNENDVNINRNFPYKWEGDSSNDKGSEPFSEISARFVRDVRNSFLDDDLNYKQGMLFVDSHDFNWNNYSNDRILWIGANDRELRKTLVNTGGIIQEKIKELYPGLVTGDHQKFFNLGATGTGYGSTINAWNWDSGVTGYSLECVNDLTPLGITEKYSLASARIGYTVVRDFIFQTTLDQCGRIPPSTIVGFNNALTNNEDNFLNTLHSIPSGRSLVVGVYNRNNRFSQHMPKDPKGRTYKGIFTATNSDGSKSTSGFMEFTTTTFKYVRRFYASYGPSTVSDWYEVGRGVVHTQKGSLGLGNSATITDIFNAMGNNQVSEIYITPKTKGINSQLTDDTKVIYGSLRVIKNTSQTGSVEHTTYSKSRNRRFINSISRGKLTDWTELLTRDENLRTSFEDLGLSDETATIIDVFNRLEPDKIAKLYVTGVTKGIHSQLPNAVNVSYGTIEIIKNTKNTGSVEHTNYSRSRNRRFFTSISQGKLTSWTEMLTESVD